MYTLDENQRTRLRRVNVQRKESREKRTKSQVFKGQIAKPVLMTSVPGRPPGIREDGSVDSHFIYSTVWVILNPPLYTFSVLLFFPGHANYESGQSLSGFRRFEREVQEN